MIAPFGSNWLFALDRSVVQCTAVLVHQASCSPGRILVAQNWCKQFAQADAA